MPDHDVPDLTDVLTHYGVHVTGLHGNRQVLCPVVDEGVPSCSVQLDKNLINCFGCGFKGDSISLIMEKEGLTRGAAYRWAEETLGFVGRTRSGRAGHGFSAGSGNFGVAYRPKALRGRTGFARA
ncbi:MAG: CHC2 zinc finger domain-containing protein [Dermatophilaceae bacterium]